jgi:acylphosphatase
MQAEAEQMSRRALHCLIEGQVQGVGYRYFAIRMAGKLNLNGYVRNLPGGDVEVVAEGEEAPLLEFLEDLKRGPSYSEVRAVRITWKKPEGRFNSFAVRY